MNSLLGMLRRYRYECIAVADGAIVMMLEMVGSRYVAPYLGTSTYVWTAIIGVILGALAIGNWYGGRLADRGPSLEVLMHVFLIASVLLFGQLAVQSHVLAWIAEAGFDPRLQAFLAALILFAPAATFMGMVSPYLAKLRLTTLAHAGASVGTLYAAGTAGSILGTFLAGYWLIGIVGSRTLGWSLVIALILVSFAVYAKGRIGLRVGLGIATICMMLLMRPGGQMVSLQSLNLLFDGDTTYARYQVYEDQYDGQTIRLLVTDNHGAQSGINLSQPYVPVFDYTARFVQAARALPSPPKHILMVGGGTFTVPKILAHMYPDVKIDVVEIDPQLTDIAKRYFTYDSPPGVRIINEDGRYFLNHAHAQYDLIYMDAFGALTPPFQLTTQETSHRLAKNLTADGLLVVNLVVTPSGFDSRFARASFATYRSVFPSAQWYQAKPGIPLGTRQNVMLLASRNSDGVKTAEQKVGWSVLAAPAFTFSDILTDDFAPVEILTARH